MSGRTRMMVSNRSAILTNRSTAPRGDQSVQRDHWDRYTVVTNTTTEREREIEGGWGFCANLKSIMGLRLRPIFYIKKKLFVTILCSNLFVDPFLHFQFQSKFN